MQINTICSHGLLVVKQERYGEADETTGRHTFFVIIGLCSVSLQLGQLYSQFGVGVFSLEFSEHLVQPLDKNVNLFLLHSNGCRCCKVCTWVCIAVSPPVSEVVGSYGFLCSQRHHPVGRETCKTSPILRLSRPVLQLCACACACILVTTIFSQWSFYHAMILEI